MPYFTIMAELRGCYADNESAFTVQVNSRKELKRHLMNEADTLRDAGAIGLNKRAVASLADQAWKNRKAKSAFPVVQGFRYPHHSVGNDCMGLMVYNADRKTYLAQQEDFI